MSEYIEQRESVLAEIENEYKNVDKIKTPFAKIIVDGTVEKPYYSILWLDKENKGYNVGYSSYCIDYVFKWLEVVFEIVAADESPAADVAPVRHAYWVPEEHVDQVSATTTHRYTWYYCSECGRRLIGYKNPIDAPYCHCGAKMDGGEDDGTST